MFLQTTLINKEDKNTLMKKQKDFEDAVQAGCAVECGADVIVTRDKTGFEDAGIPAYTPTELLERHTSA